MVSTLTKKAWNDLSRRKARTIFTIITVALAVGSLGLLFVSPMMDRVMVSEVEEGRLHNIRYTLASADLNESEIAAFDAIDNVKGAEAYTIFITKVVSGERACKAVLVGVDSFSGQKADRIYVLSGKAPAPLEVLGEATNAKYTAFTAGQGSTATVLDAGGRERTLAITGTGRSLQFSVYSQYIGAVFYTTSETVRALAGTAATTFLDIDLSGDGDRQIAASTAAIESTLSAVEPLAVLRSTPEIVKDVNWPGKEGFNSMMAGFSIITWLALLTGVVLISNTMNTTMLEQTREIGCLKAVGATRRQVARLYLTMAAIIGALGSLLGITVGVLIGNWMCLSLGPIFGIAPAVSVYLPGLLISFAAGVGISVAAAAPALWRGMRLGTREALDENTKGYKGTGRLMQALTGSRSVPRTIQMGSRNVGRNTGRSAATVIQLALAVATLLSMASIGSSVQASISSAFDDLDYDVEMTSQGGLGGLNSSVGEHIMAVPGVKLAEPFAATNFRLSGNAVSVYGLPGHTRTHIVRIVEGRWFSDNECTDAKQVAVLSTSLSRLEGVHTGGSIIMKTPAGDRSFLVVGLSDTIVQMGRVVYVPMPTIQSILGMGQNVSGFSVKLASDDHGFIDKTSASIEHSLGADGIVVEGQVMYLLERQNIQGFMDVMNMIEGLGFIIVLISMVGLANNLTMNVLERTREIGMMRCIGAGAGSIRAVFSSEGLVLMTAGWALGVPLGFALGGGLFWWFLDAMAVSMPFVFPAAYALISLIAVVGVGALVIQVPITRAVRIPPGDALRYQ